ECFNTHRLYKTFHQPHAEERPARSVATLGSSYLYTESKVPARTARRFRPSTHDPISKSWHRAFPASASAERLAILNSAGAAPCPPSTVHPSCSPERDGL